MDKTERRQVRELVRTAGGGIAAVSEEQMDAVDRMREQQERDDRVRESIKALRVTDAFGALVGSLHTTDLTRTLKRTIAGHLRSVADQLENGWELLDVLKEQRQTFACLADLHTILEKGETK